MNGSLLTAAALLIAIAIAHSLLGERYILMRLFRRDDLPRLFGSDWFTRRTLRFVWHVTSLAWLGFAAVLMLLSQSATPTRDSLLSVVSLTFLLTATVAAVASRGRHLSWVVFLAVAVLAWSAS